MSRYRHGLVEIADQTFAWLQPDGSWGLSNAGLIADGDASLLVDTLFDHRSTAEMLAAMRRATRAAERIDTLVNTHANGDHCWGNALVGGARIVASEACAAEMKALPPPRVAFLVALARRVARLGRLRTGLGRLADTLGATKIRDLCQAAPLVADIFSSFRFDEVVLALPNETFVGRKELMVGDTAVTLYEVGPAHTQGDVLVHVPARRLVFTGDILFQGAHPVIWAGPLENWLAACDLILGLPVDVVVPGHGPVTDKGGVEDLRGYLQFLVAEVGARHAAGMPAEEAARDIDFGAFGHWSESERIVANVRARYRELDGLPPEDDPVAAFAAMARFAGRA